VTALLAYLLPSKVGLTAMACAVNPLAWRFTNEILSTGTARDCESDIVGRLLLLPSNLLTRLLTRPLTNSLLALALILRLLDTIFPVESVAVLTNIVPNNGKSANLRVPRALLASLVIARIADLVGPERSRALMASAMNPHANILLNTITRRSS